MLPGGHVGIREKSEDCAARELREETKLKVKAKRLLRVQGFLNQHPGYAIEFFFLVAPVGKVKPAFDSASKSEFKFMALEKLEHLTFYPHELIMKLKALREDRDWTEKSLHLRSVS
jgi:ADP-ribose pyrophosphatase YjhB (NUDIX family)